MPSTRISDKVDACGTISINPELVDTGITLYVANIPETSSFLSVFGVDGTELKILKEDSGEDENLGLIESVEDWR